MKENTLKVGEQSNEEGSGGASVAAMKSFEICDFVKVCRQYG